MPTYEPVIGLEIHAQLRTRTKIFCGCTTDFGAAPNTHICPVCLGLILSGLSWLGAALALGCEVQARSIFARKNYFYPDLPKGYQISQYAEPLALGGGIEVDVDGTTSFVRLTRIHMEEDAGKSLHDGFADSDRKTYLDFNRAGTPLIEIVSEPDMRSAAQAATFFERLRQLLVWIGVNDGNMDEGSLRCDANVSVRPAGTTTLGTKAEVKNVNSFRYLQKAIEFEIGRQIDVLEQGGRVVQETRLFDAAQGKTYSMRSKEEAHDYRYFPDPDLPPLVVSSTRLEEARAALPELPDARRARLMTQFGLPAYDADVLTQSKDLADYFEATASASGLPKAASNWVMGEVLRTMKERVISVADVPITPEALARLLRLVDAGTISSTVAKDVFATMYETGRAADEIVASEGLAQVSDTSAIEPHVMAVLADHPDVVAEIRAGKDRKFQFLVGQVMKASKGKADPKVVTDLLMRAIG